MKLKFTLTTMILAVCVNSFALAEESPGDAKKPGTGPNPYSDCGIGAALFKETSWAAVSSNVIWDLGSTAITSATASPQTCQGKNLKVALFINDTYKELAEEAAAGQGKHLTTALNILECESSRHPTAIQAIRNAMSQTVSNPGYANQTHLEKSADFYGIINNAVSNSCLS